MISVNTGKTGMDGGDVLYPDVLWKSVDMGEAP
jgi:hypothetical protein